MKEKLKVRNGSRVSLKESGCCGSSSHSGYGVVSEMDQPFGVFRVVQGGDKEEGSYYHNILCIDKVIRY